MNEKDVCSQEVLKKSACEVHEASMVEQLERRREELLRRVNDVTEAITMLKNRPDLEDCLPVLMRARIL